MTNELTGKTVVVLGATGNVGAGAVQGALERGARVIVSSRSADGVAALRKTWAGQNVEVLEGDLATQLTEVDHVVASMGGWWTRPGRFEDQPAASWPEVRGMLLDSHVIAATTLLPKVRESGSYTLITGAGAITPMPTAHLLTIALGGTLALSRVLRFEHRSSGCRVNEVRISSRIEKVPRPGVVPSADFGRALTKLLEADVRSAIVPFTRPEMFDPAVHLPDGQP